MMMTPSLRSIEDLYGKLQREAYRVYHASEKTDKTDHFYNFCVTAHAMKDYFFEHKMIFGEHLKQDYHHRWSDDPVLFATFEIANAYKHLVLREKSTKAPKNVKTKGVEEKDSMFVYISVEADGGLQERFVEKPDLLVTLRDGKAVELWKFTAHVTRFWRTALEREGIEVPR